MSKKQKKSNSNRPRSKNNLASKRDDPPTDWAAYDKSHQSEGQRYAEWMLRVADIAREIMGIPKGKHDWRVSAIWWA